jgi:hypothetical protein
MQTNIYSDFIGIITIMKMEMLTAAFIMVQFLSQSGAHAINAGSILPPLQLFMKSHDQKCKK